MVDITSSNLVSHIHMEDFSIQIDDGSEMIPDMVLRQNARAVHLYDWQERAIDYFFKHGCSAIYEVSTGAGKTFCAIEILKRIWNSGWNGLHMR